MSYPCPVCKGASIHDGPCLHCLAAENKRLRETLETLAETQHTDSAFMSAFARAALGRVLAQEPATAPGPEPRECPLNGALCIADAPASVRITGTDLLCSLSPDEYERLSVPSEAEILAAFEKGKRDRDKVEAARGSTHPDPSIRYK
jgi:hypothetical protein